MAVTRKRTATKRASATRRSTSGNNTGGGGGGGSRSNELFPLTKPELRKVTQNFNQWMKLGQDIAPHMRKLETFIGGTTGTGASGTARTRARATGPRQTQRQAANG